MARKSNATAAKLSYAGHLLMEHRNALIVDIDPAEGFTMAVAEQLARWAAALAKPA